MKPNLDPKLNANKYSKHVRPEVLRIHVKKGLKEVLTGWWLVRNKNKSENPLTQ